MNKQTEQQKNPVLNCPRCGKELDEKHRQSIGRAILATAMLQGHLRSLEKRDFYCIECFEETE